MTQRRTMTMAFAAITIACGLVLRLSHLPIPFVAYKYGGSMLWAAAIYWLLAAAFPRWTISRAATTSALLAACIEFFKLYHSPTIDALRLTLAGKLILGRVFSWKDIAAYMLAIAIAALLDKMLLHSKAASPAKA
jgi:Protein of unknown function (DUF2809)